MKTTIPARGLLVLRLLLLPLIPGACLVSVAQPSSKIVSCTAPEYRQFDFWIGDWDAFEFGNTKAPLAHIRVDRILDGCVVREDYRDADGKEGRSFSIYDGSRKLWHQTWVTNNGQLLVIEGKVADGEMIMTGADPTAGEHALVRGRWKAVEEGVREIGEKSSDGGENWKPWFDLLFRSRK